MDKNKQDSTTRGERTRNALKQAAERMLLEKGYSALTVQDIVEGAGVARGTYYIYFDDLDDVIWALVSDAFKYFDPNPGPGSADPDRLRSMSWLNIFQFVDGQRALLGELLGPRGHIQFYNQLGEFLAATLREDLAREPIPGLTELPDEAVTQYVVGALLRLVTWWLTVGEELTAQEITALFYQATLRRGMPPMR
jgi:AcrR family transcriptional regulator